MAKAQKKSTENFPVLIVGNKSDLADEMRQVSYTQGNEFAKSICAQFIETSAKTGENVSEAFELLIRSLPAYNNHRKTDTSSSKQKKDRCILC